MDFNLHDSLFGSDTSLLLVLKDNSDRFQCKCRFYRLCTFVSLLLHEWTQHDAVTHSWPRNSQPNGQLFKYEAKKANILSLSNHLCTASKSIMADLQCGNISPGLFDYLFWEKKNGCSRLCLIIMTHYRDTSYCYTTRINQYALYGNLLNIILTWKSKKKKNVSLIQSAMKGVQNKLYVLLLQQKALAVVSHNDPEINTLPLYC